MGGGLRQVWMCHLGSAFNLVTQVLRSGAASSQDLDRSYYWQTLLLTGRQVNTTYTTRMGLLLLQTLTLGTSTKISHLCLMSIEYMIARLLQGSNDIYDKQT